MELRPLGTTGMLVSPIGLGTVKLGRNQRVKYPGAFALPTDEEATALLQRAAELGINLLDTAPAYGASEERLGELMSRAGWFGGRDRWVISTKAGEEFSAGESRFDFSARAIRASVERSLLRLRLDVLDVVLLHSSGDDLAILAGEAPVALAELKRQGKTRAIGISTKTVEGGLAAAHGGACDVIMVTYNPRDTADAAVIDTARSRAIAVLVKKGLLSGHVNQVASITPGGDPVEDSLRFIFARPGVSSVVVGTVNPDHLQHNVRAAAHALASSNP
jgi:aryl-alcohol dehydrogenase-like predicted oxidoreductase